MVMRAKLWILVLVAAVAAALFLAVRGLQTQDTILISLGKTSDISPVQQTSGDDSGDNSIRVAIAGVLSPSETLEAYQGLLTYMGQQLGRQVTLILKPTYAEINDLVEGQSADIAFICSLSYVQGNEDFGMELLVAPQMYGKIVYYSYLIVPPESTATGLQGLRGTSFAFTDPLSNSGHLAPTYELSLLGETPSSFFSGRIFTYSHDNSIKAVANKLVQGAAVDSLVYDQMVADNPELAAKTKIIDSWGPYGIPPVVVSPALDPQLEQQLRDFFLDLHNSEEGMRILNDLNIDKFVVVTDSNYDSIRDMKMKLGW